MAYTSRPWIRKSAVKRLSELQQRYEMMTKPGVIEKAAQVAGGTLAQGMRSMVRSQSDLGSYQAVADGFTTWKSEDGAIHVGLPPGHRLVEQAIALERQFALQQTTMDMDRQTGDSHRSFYDTLAKLAGF